MDAVGLVVEFNPFHNGHLYYVQKAKQVTGADVAVAVMSGDFTQRGEPTIVDKWQRAHAALLNGVDLVVELPICYACQPAHRFAAGALGLLNQLQVKNVAFGAEHPDWDFKKLVVAARDFNQQALKQYNETYATQFNDQLAQRTGVSLKDPNDILAFAYTKAVSAHHYPINLVPIARKGSNYHDEEIHGRIASASAIREAVADHAAFAPTVPPAMLSALQALATVPSWTALYPLLRNQLIQAPVASLAQTYQMAEGLEHRMKEFAERKLTFQGFIHGIKTKRYTYAHLLRLCLYTTLQLNEDEVAAHIDQPFIHILGFNKRGQEYLHQVKKGVAVPMFTKVSQEMKEDLYNLDYRAGKLYQNFTPADQDLKHPPLIIR